MVWAYIPRHEKMEVKVIPTCFNNIYRIEVKYKQYEADIRR